MVLVWFMRWVFLIIHRSLWSNLSVRLYSWFWRNLTWQTVSRHDGGSSDRFWRWNRWCWLGILQLWLRLRSCRLALCCWWTCLRRGRRKWGGLARWGWGLWCYGCIWGCCIILLELGIRVSLLSDRRGRLHSREGWEQAGWLDCWRRWQGRQQLWTYAECWWRGRRAPKVLIWSRWWRGRQVVSWLWVPWYW